LNAFLFSNSCSFPFSALSETYELLSSYAIISFS
jgi:hypothetical protein